MELSFLGLWYVCAFGAAVFAAAFAAGMPLGWRPVAAASLAFLACAWWVVPAGVVGVAPTALVTAVVAGWGLSRPMSLRPTSALVLAVAAGALAGLWTGLLTFQGLPWAAAIAVAASVPLMSAMLAARRPTFAPPVLRDESLLIVCALSLAIAALPSITDGWRAAGEMALQGDVADLGGMMPMWALALTGAAATLGGVYSVWSRR